MDLDPTTKQPSIVGFAPGASDAVHVGLHPSGEFAVTAEYGDAGGPGHLTTYRIASDGTPIPIESREARPKMHSARFSSDGRFVYAASQQDNVILQYAFSAEDGRIEPLEPEAVTAIAGGGEPRHVLPHPDGKRLYVTGQMPPVLLGFTINENSGTLSEAAGAVALFESAVMAEGYGKDLVLAPAGTPLYTTTWSVDLLTTFSLAESGQATRTTSAATGGYSAQGIAIDPKGALLLVAHDGDLTGISIFSLDGPSPALLSRIEGLEGQGVAAVDLP
jgi:6-phosphogluconolactonase